MRAGATRQTAFKCQGNITILPGVIAIINTDVVVCDSTVGPAGWSSSINLAEPTLQISRHGPHSSSAARERGILSSHKCLATLTKNLRSLVSVARGLIVANLSAFIKLSVRVFM